MQTTDAVQRVRIYLTEADQVDGRPLYLATLDMLREAGATGATAVRAIAGFGTTQTVGNERALPVIIEWIDRAERVTRVLPALDALLPNALITLEPVQVFRATLRSSGPFGERTVGELLLASTTTATTQQSLLEAVLALVESNQDVLPILDANGRVAGTFGNAELRRQQLPELSSLRALPPAEREHVLAKLQDLPLVANMTSEVLALTSDTAVRQAAHAMVEWGLNQVPVIQRNGTFAGLFGTDQALDAALDAQPSSAGIRDATAATPVSLLMQQAVQTVLGYALATEGLERLAATTNQPLIVVDNGRPLGLLDRNFLRSQAEPPLSQWLADPAQLPADTMGEMRVATLPLAPIPELASTASYHEAITLLRQSGAPWAAVVDDERKLQGIVGPRTLLRALVQESGG